MITERLGRVVSPHKERFNVVITHGALARGARI